MVGPEIEAPRYKDLPLTPWMTSRRVRDYDPALEADGQIRTAIQILYMQNSFKCEMIRYLMYNALHNGFDEPLTR